MRYQVPQFIEVEDKIFGPFTIKQFVYLAGGGGVCLAAFTTLPFFVALLIALPAGGLALALAFYTVNGRPFVNALEHAFMYFISHKLYLWKAREGILEENPSQSRIPESTMASAPRITEGKLKDLAWQLNIKDKERGPSL
ncbi:MAG TPA: PrgI family protein [Candidatus Paceibacterota bacterium]